jgi:Beta-lactamase enzyme family
MTLQFTLPSAIRSSWQFDPIDGMGRESGKPRRSQLQNSQEKASLQAAAPENGGVLIFPCNQTIGFVATPATYVRTDIFTRAIGMGSDMSSWLLIVIRSADPEAALSQCELHDPTLLPPFRALAQEFNSGIPAGLPPGTRVAHKTGSITKIAHDAALVFDPDGSSYVLVVLTRGFAKEAEAERVIAGISHAVWKARAALRP